MNAKREPRVLVYEAHTCGMRKTSITVLQTAIRRSISASAILHDAMHTPCSESCSACKVHAYYLIRMKGENQ